MGRLTRRRLEREDFINALKEMNTFTDVNVDTLMEIFDKAERHASLRTAGNIPVRNLMTHPVMTVHPDATLSAAARQLVTGRISGLPVVDGEQRLLGIITEADFLRALGVPSHHPTHNLWQTLESMFLHPVELHESDDLVSSLMISDVITVGPSATLHDVVSLMKKNRIKRVVVCDDDRRVLGIVTRSNLVRVFFDKLCRVAEDAEPRGS